MATTRGFLIFEKHEDIAVLKSKGIAEVFLPGTSTEDIVRFINANVKAER